MVVEEPALLSSLVIKKMLEEPLCVRGGEATAPFEDHSRIVV